MAESNRKLRTAYGDLIEAAEAQGWTVEIRRGGHVKFTSPDGTPVFASSSPSDKRAVKNIRSNLRRAGLSC